MTIVINSDSYYVGQAIFPLTDAFVARVEADGGEVVDIGYLQSAEIFLKANNLADKVFSFASPKFAVKKVGSAVSVIYSLFGGDGDFIIAAGASPTFNSDHTVVIAGSGSNKYKTQADIQSGDISLLTAFTTTVNITVSSSLFNAYNGSNRCVEGLYAGANKTLSAYGVGDTMGGAAIPALNGKNTFAVKSNTRGITAIANGTQYKFPASYRNVTNATIHYASAPVSAGMTANYSAFAAAIDLTDEELLAFEQYLRSTF